MPKKPEHVPSNSIETNTLLDAYLSGQLSGRPTLIQPDAIEIASDQGVQSFDPALVDPQMLAQMRSQYGQPYGPMPESYEGLGAIQRRLRRMQ